MPTDARAEPSPETSPAADVPTASYVFLTIVSGLSLAADLLTKAWAKHRLAGFDAHTLGPKRIEVIKDHFDFVFALNPGGAWSFLRSMPDSLRRPFFLFVSASAVVFIVSIYRRVPQSHRAMRWGLPLALGGAMGNLVDRIRYGQVIDFIDFYITRNGREIHWPTYNVADIAIVVGVGLMVIDMLLPGPSALKAVTTTEGTAAAAGATAAATETTAATTQPTAAADEPTAAADESAAVGTGFETALVDEPSADPFELVTKSTRSEPDEPAPADEEPEISLGVAEVDLAAKDEAQAAPTSERPAPAPHI